jgi:hypothetical protein
MEESFNIVLKGICAMPVNAIVLFTFYRLVAWFNERHMQWHDRAIMSHGHLNLNSILIRQRMGPAHMRSNALTTTRASTRS